MAFRAKYGLLERTPVHATVDELAAALDALKGEQAAQDARLREEKALLLKRDMIGRYQQTMVAKQQVELAKLKARGEAGQLRPDDARRFEETLARLQELCSDTDSNMAETKAVGLPRSHSDPSLASAGTGPAPQKQAQEDEAQPRQRAADLPARSSVLKSMAREVRERAVRYWSAKELCPPPSAPSGGHQLSEAGVEGAAECPPCAELRGEEASMSPPPSSPRQPQEHSEQPPLAHEHEHGAPPAQEPSAEPAPPQERALPAQEASEPPVACADERAEALTQEHAPPQEHAIPTQSTSEPFAVLSAAVALEEESKDMHTASGERRGSLPVSVSSSGLSGLSDSEMAKDEARSWISHEADESAERSMAETPTRSAASPPPSNVMSMYDSARNGDGVVVQKLLSIWASLPASLTPVSLKGFKLAPEELDSAPEECGPGISPAFVPMSEAEARALADVEIWGCD